MVMTFAGVRRSTACWPPRPASACSAARWCSCACGRCSRPASWPSAGGWHSSLDSLLPCRPWVRSPRCSTSGTRRSTPTAGTRSGWCCGDPAADVRRILLAVDPVAAVVDEAVLHDADLLVTHHPLFLKGVHGFAATDPKGRVAHRLVTQRLRAVHRPHQRRLAGRRASRSRWPGARARGRPPAGGRPRRRRWTRSWCSRRSTPPRSVRAAIDQAGAGRIGDYEQASFTTTGEGRFRPLEGATPAIGEVGALRDGRRGPHRDGLPAAPAAGGVAAMLAAHPYEEPAYDVIELAAARRARPWLRAGSGRLSEPMTLRAFADAGRRARCPRPRTASASRVTPTSCVETVGAVRRRRRLPARPGPGARAWTST